MLPFISIRGCCEFWLSSIYRARYDHWPPIFRKRWLQFQLWFTTVGQGAPTVVLKSIFSPNSRPKRSWIEPVSEHTWAQTRRRSLCCCWCCLDNDNTPIYFVRLFKKDSSIAARCVLPPVCICLQVFNSWHFNTFFKQNLTNECYYIVAIRYCMIEHRRFDALFTKKWVVIYVFRPGLCPSSGSRWHAVCWRARLTRLIVFYVRHTYFRPHHAPLLKMLGNRFPLRLESGIVPSRRRQGS